MKLTIVEKIMIIMLTLIFITQIIIIKYQQRDNFSTAIEDYFNNNEIYIVE